MPNLFLNTIALDPNRWTQHKTPRYRLIHLLPDVQAAGFRNLEVWHYHLSTLNPEEVDLLMDRARALGFTFPIVGIYPVLHLDGAERDREAAEMTRLISESARVGARVVKFFAGRKGSAEVDADAYARSLEFTREMLATAAEHGIILTAEVHPDTLCDTIPATRRLLGDLDAPNLRLCFQPLDFTNTQQAIADYASLHEHIIHIHLQGRRNDRMCLLENADIDYRRFLSALKDHGFTGYLSIEFVEGCVVERPEYFHLERVLENAVRDREFVKGVVGWGSIAGNNEE